MLRALVIALLAANLAFYAWTQGWLSGVLGLPPEGDREPQRLAAQIDPNALQIGPAAPAASRAAPVEPAASEAAPPAPADTPASGALPPLPAPGPASEAPTLAAVPAPPTTASASAAAEPSTVCLEGGPFNPAEWRTAETALRHILGDGNWTLTTREKPGNWMVYVGPYKSRVIMDKRADQLRQMEIAFEEARNLPDEYIPGFVFGRYGVEADARALQTRLTARKIKYVRVVPLVKPATTHTVRIPKATTDVQTRLQALRPKLGGHTFSPCKDDGRRP
jgi:hypothetical protein